MSKDSSRSVRGLLLAAALVASSAATASAEVSLDLQTFVNKGALTVCLYPGFKPFASMEDNVWQGWDVDFLRNFAASINLNPDSDFKIKSEDFDGIWLQPGQDQCDIAGTGISDTADRRAATNIPGHVGCWSSTYYGVLRTFLVRTEDYARLNDVRDLAGKTAIVTKGSTANIDLCYRMRLAGLNPCLKKNDSPCGFQGLDGFEAKTREDDGACVDIEYPRPGQDGKGDERNSACDVANNELYERDKKAPWQCTNKLVSDPPFTYGGGYGSIRILTDTPDQSLATVWPHCNMGSDFQAYSEPFSFVVRAKSKGLLKAINDYIAKTQKEGPPTAYEGTPIPDVGCEVPPWTKEPQPDVCPSN